MTNLSTDEARTGIIGVDTHKDVHVAVAIDPLGRKIDQRASATNAAGLSDLLA